MLDAHERQRREIIGADDVQEMNASGFAHCPPAFQGVVQPRWEKRIHGPGSVSYLLHLGICETWLFAYQTGRWYIRCGSRWRQSNGLFEGTLAEAKAEAKRFTAKCLEEAKIALDKNLYRIPGSEA